MQHDADDVSAGCLAGVRNTTSGAGSRYKGAMALWDRKWLHAQLNLAWHLVRHFTVRLWPWRRRYKLERFRDNYVHEGLPPASEAFRKSAHFFGQCTGCGACDETCPLMREMSRTDFVGPMSLILSGARSAPDLDSVESSLRLMVGPQCQECQRCDAVCPEEIPLLHLAELLLKQLHSTEEARQKRIHSGTASPLS